MMIRDHMTPQNRLSPLAKRRRLFPTSPPWAPRDREGSVVMLLLIAVVFLVVVAVSLVDRTAELAEERDAAVAACAPGTER